jgi:hypothetical protein
MKASIQLEGVARETAVWKRSGILILLRVCPTNFEYFGFDMEKEGYIHKSGC